MNSLVGQSLGRYHILEQFGEGGMAVVYKAYDTRLESDVAVKVIRTENLAPVILERALKRFEREAKALAKLTHSNIVKVLDYGEFDGKPYLVMPFLPGGTLKDKLHGHPMPWAEAARILIPIARALGYAHEQNMVHRDVKPSNILITHSGDPMLTDFGIAKIIDEEATMDLTGTSAAVGTPEYMAPEQVVSKNVDHRADIYALGIVFYEMITGRRPFTADTPMAVLFKHASEALPRPVQFVPGLPPMVEQILIKALAKSPEDRYQDMAAFAAALEKALAQAAPVAHTADETSTLDDAPTLLPRTPTRPPTPTHPPTPVPVAPAPRTPQPVRATPTPMPAPAKTTALHTPSNISVPKSMPVAPTREYSTQSNLQKTANRSWVKWALGCGAIAMLVLIVGIGAILSGAINIQLFDATATDAPAALVEATKSSTGAPTPAFRSKDPTTFVVVGSGDPETLDPARSYETVGGEIIQNVYETLVFYDGEATDKFVPQLADSWEVSADGRTYTFHIRSGIKFHDGGDLTPSDVAYSFQRGLLFGGYSGPQWLLAEPFFGVGYDDISLIAGDGSCTDDPACMQALPSSNLLSACQKVTESIVADEAAGTVTMTLAQAWGPFIATIAQPWGSVMDKEWTTSHGGWDGNCSTWQNYYATPIESDPFTTIMNGTGPFKFDHWTQGEEIVLVRNDDYWREPAKLERVIFKNVAEWGTRFSMMQAGDADLVYVPAESRAQMDELVGEMRVFNLNSGSYNEAVTVCSYSASAQGADKFTSCSGGNPGTGGPFRLYIGRPSVVSSDLFFTFQIAESSNYVGSGQLDGNGIPRDFFSDIHIRKAFAYCFDWDTYINDVYDGEAIQQSVIPRQGMPGYQGNAPVYTYDPAMCEAEFKLADLDKDGRPAGSDPSGDVWTTGFRLQAVYNEGNTSREIVSEILSSNISAINDLFVVESVGLPWPTFLSTIRASEAPYFLGGWLEDIHDPHNWYQPYMIGTYANRQQLPDNLREQFQELINQGVSQTDPDQRHRTYLQLNALYYENVPALLLATATSHGFEQRWVHGVILNPVFPGNYYYTIYKD